MPEITAMIFIKLEKPVNQSKTIHFNDIQQDCHLLRHFLENKQLKLIWTQTHIKDDYLYIFN